MNEEENKRSYEWLTELVKVSVLGWSAALLTLSYMGYFQKMDPKLRSEFLVEAIEKYVSHYSCINQCKSCDHLNIDDTRYYICTKCGVCSSCLGKGCEYCKWVPSSESSSDNDYSAYTCVLGGEDDY